MSSTSTSICTSSSRPHRRSRKVTFSRYSELAIVPKADKDVSNNIWYSSKERSEFRRTLSEDVRRVSSSQAASQAAHVAEGAGDVSVVSTLPKVQAYETVGIEVFLNQELTKRVMETKTAHVHSVLVEQSRQRRQGIHDVEKLAHASEQSAWTQERARIIATGYWLQYIFER